jgi:hypothetical protein
MKRVYSIRQQELTAQFYAWELLGRGWLHAETPAELEPPFTPFFGHNNEKGGIEDDGVHHTLFSSIASLFHTKLPTPAEVVLPEISYELFPFQETSLLVTYTVLLQSQHKTSSTDAIRFLTMLSYITRPMSFEIHADHQHIKLLFISRQEDASYLESQLRTYFPHYVYAKKPTEYDVFSDSSTPTVSVDFGLKEEWVRPMSQYRQQDQDSLLGILSQCEHIQPGISVMVQVLCNGVVNHWQQSMLSAVTDGRGGSFFEDAPEMLPMTKEKIQHPLMACTIRAAVSAPTYEVAYAKLDTLCFAITTQSSSHGNSLIPLVDEGYTPIQRLNDIRYRQSHRGGMLLNILEVAQFIHIPTWSPAITKLYRKERTTKAAPAIMRGHDFVLGNNLHQQEEVSVTISTEERLKHTHIIGATGTGKSTLIANMLLQDIEAGRGVALFDPHGDLVEEMMSRIPSERIKDVVIIDPSDSEYPVGINILEAHSDIEKEILASDVVASFRKLSTSWGDQMNAVFGNAILAFLESSRGGSLHDLRRFLVEKEFRQDILADITDPSIVYYWQKEYPLLKTNSMGPILTRLDTFLRPRLLRNMIVQRKGIDFNTLVESRAILLVKLSQGLIGSENSYLLGSLLLSKLHQAAFARQQQSSSRQPFFIYIDEFQHFVTPSVKDMLSGVRKYNVGLILSHQDLQQVQKEDPELLHSMLSNTSTRIVFRVGEQDAKRISEGFGSFAVSDFLNQGKGEAIIRIEQPQYDATVQTIPLSQVSSEQKQLTKETVLSHSRKQYANSREAVEQQLRETLHIKTDIRSDALPEKKQRVVGKSDFIRPVKEELKELVPQAGSRELEETEDISTHRYLQTLIKKMGESKGYTATVEAAIPTAGGQVDVLLVKDKERIAVEVCVTTDPKWEMHNIEKCCKAGFERVISVSGDKKQLEKIRKECEESITDFAQYTVSFLTPDALFTMLDEEMQLPVSQTEAQVMKGYRINLNYGSISSEEIIRKRSAIAKIVVDTLRKQKK